MRHLRQRLVRLDDRGFTLIEAVVSLFLAVLFFVALGISVLDSVRASVQARQNQQASDIVTQAVEKVRAMPYNTVAMRTSDLADPVVSGLSAAKTYNSTTDATSGGEPLHLDDAGGAVYPHITTVVQNHATYTVRQYVTTVTDTVNGAAYRRLTVRASWTTYGRTRTRSVSTLITDTLRGLPLPDFKLTPVGQQSQCLAPGTTIAFGLKLTNNGARDQWLMTSSTSGWNWFFDANGDNSYDPAVDTTPLGSNGGTPTTGDVEPTASTTYFAVKDISGGDPTGTFMVTFTATSFAQPTFPAQTISDTYTVQSAACGGSPSSPPPPPTSPPPSSPPSPPPAAAPPVPCVNPSAAASGANATIYNYPLLAKISTGSDTTATAGEALGAKYNATVTGTALYDESTNWHASRELGRGLVSSKGVAWSYTFGNTSTLKGTAVLKLFARSTVASGSTPVAVTAVIKRGAITLATLGTAITSTPSWVECQSQGLAFSFTGLPASGQGVQSGDVLTFTVSTTATATTTDLLYGTTTFPAYFQLPVKTGTGL